MKMPKKVNKKDIIKSLQESIVKNDEALDYLKNKIESEENLYKYHDCKDEELKRIIDLLKYTEFTLKFVGEQYKESLRKYGVN